MGDNHESSWRPKKQITNYIFYDSLQDFDFPYYEKIIAQYEKIESALADNITRLSQKDSILEQLYLQEKAKEQKFVENLRNKKVNGKPLIQGPSPKGGGDAAYLIQLNLLLNYRSIFERNIKKIQGTDQNYKEGHSAAIDITSVMDRYLEEAANKYLGKDDNTLLRKLNLIESESDKSLSADGLEEIVSNIVKIALDDIAASRQTTKKEDQQNGIQPLKEFFDDLNAAKAEGLNIQDELIEAIRDEILTENKRQEWIQNGKANRVKASDIKKQIKSNVSNIRGISLESFVAATIKAKAKGNRKIEVAHTGGINEMKADNIAIFGKNVLDFDVNIDEIVKTAYEKASSKEEYQKMQSVRARNRQIMKELLRELKMIEGDIVMISDKNYRLTKNFQGFQAEKVSLDNLEEGLRAFTVSGNSNLVSEMGGNKISRLIFALTNIGPGAIEDGVSGQEALNLLATQIGYFLFDDIEMSFSWWDTMDVNVIHLMNLDGIYVPLSMILKGVLDGIREYENGNEDEIADYVNVNVNHSGLHSYQHREGPLTEADWQNEARQAHSEIYLTVKIMSKFSEMISNIKKGGLTI